MSIKKKLLEAAAGASTGGAFTAIEDVFSTYLYTGNGSTQTITNGIDLAGEGGMVWVKNRGLATANVLHDTERGVSKPISTNSVTSQQDYPGYGVTSFNSDGFAITDDTNGNYSVNKSSYNYASWTFRKAPRFFDVVTYTGDGVAGRQIAHNLGIEPGFIAVKSTSLAESWACYHTSLGGTKYLSLQANGSVFTSASRWNNTNPNDATFTVGSDGSVNQSGATYVAYLFAHDPLGISKCGSYTGNGTSQTIDCGFTSGARFVLIKRTDSAGDWYVWDTARGIVAANDPHLSLNTTAAEVTTDDSVDPDSSGFIVNQVSGFTATNINVSSASYIYLAIA